MIIIWRHNIFDLLTYEQLRLVILIYISALLPAAIIPLLHKRKLIPAWVLPFYLTMFVVCALGWELWFNYGLTVVQLWLTMAQLWLTMVQLWFDYGVTLVSLWFNYG